MSTTTVDRFEFVLALHKEIRATTSVLPSDCEIAKLASKLIRHGRTLHRLAEHLCNYGEDATYTAMGVTQTRVRDLLEPYGIGAVFSGDPRGCCLKLVFPITKRTNGWGGEGYCVPS